MSRDILLNENDDLMIKDGDFVTGESTLQHQTLLLYCNKGEFKESPTRCVGLIRFVEGNDVQALAREIDMEFSLDGMKVDRIAVNLPVIEIEASYD